jgi:hypothetical protein
MNDDNDKNIRGTNLWLIFPIHLTPASRHTANVCAILFAIAILVSSIYIIIHMTFIANSKSTKNEFITLSLTAENRHLKALLKMRTQEVFSYSSDIRSSNTPQRYSLAQQDTSSRSFAVVMPCLSSQLRAVLKNLDLWIQYSPHDNGVANLQRVPVDLIFYFNSDKEHTQENDIRAHVHKLGLQKKYFRNVLFRYANLVDKEEQPRGSTHQFYKLMDDETFRSEYDYFFYMEPDCIPIRNGWLDILQELTFVRLSPFWVQGSIYRGDAQVQDVQRLHINGNAIYSTADSYYNFLKSVRGYAFHAYDIDQYIYLTADFERQKHIYHKFVTSEFIMNMWNTRYSLKKLKFENRNTYLVYGGRNTDKQ